MMNKKKEAIRISSNEVSKAIQNFVKNGGLIRALPAQNTPPRSMGDRYGTTESLLERTMAV